jgi:hypothetical protein
MANAGREKMHIFVAIKVIYIEKKSSRDDVNLIWQLQETTIALPGV